jgi:hypothetical protein
MRSALGTNVLRYDRVTSYMKSVILRWTRPFIYGLHQCLLVAHRLAMDYLGTQCASKTLLSGSIESDDSQIPFRRYIQSPTNQLRKLSAALLTCRSRTKVRLLLFKLTLLRHGQHVVERKAVHVGLALLRRHARFGTTNNGLGRSRSDQTCASTTSSSPRCAARVHPLH